MQSPPPPAHALQPREVTLEAPAFGALAQELLRTGHAIRFRAAGGSMRPFVHDGDVLTVVPAALAECRPGDVVLHRANAGAVAHRLLAVRRRGGETILLIRGDASSAAAQVVPAAELLGCATQRERNGRATRLDRGFPRLLGRLWAWKQRVRGWLRARM